MGAGDAEAFAMDGLAGKERLMTNRLVEILRSPVELFPHGGKRALSTADAGLDTNGTLLIVASVPICSAAKTGCHSGRRNSAPIGRSVGHSAISRPIIGTFW